MGKPIGSSHLRRGAAALWRWRWALLVNLYLISPVLIYESRVGQGGPDRTLLFILPASLLTLAAAQLVLRRFWLTHALMAPLYLVVATDLYVIAHYRTRLDSSILLLLVENVGDAGEFVRANLAGLLVCLAPLLAGYALCLFKLRPLVMTAGRGVLVATLLLTAALYTAVKLQVGLVIHLALNDRSSPFGIFPQAYTAWSVFADEAEQARASRGFLFGARRADVQAGPEAYVLVIGESARPDHWGLYGYPRDTTPRLGRERGLVAFRNAIAQSALTKASVPLLLTRGALEDPSRAAREKSVVSAFHEAGFHTFWLSTQQRDPFTGAINRYSGEADAQHFFQRRHDGILAEQAAQILADPAEQKVFLVIHQMGSHYFYENRFPAAFEAFPTTGAGLSGKEELINAYDDTVLYSDFVIDLVIDALKKRPGLSALFYVSDHGENLEDDKRKLQGHCLHNEWDLPIAMFFWPSDAFAAKYPERLAPLARNARAPINTRAVFHSLIEMAGISVGDPDTPRLSVFSDALTVAPRLVTREPLPVDFDLWLKHANIAATSLPRDHAAPGAAPP